MSYEEHRASINTITFCDNNNKFVTSSDDKKLYLWEFGCVSVIKQLGENDTGIVTSTYPMSNGKGFIGQTSDNKILVFDTTMSNLRVNKKKKFVGHKSMGYAITCGISPDDKYVYSGDYEGRLFFWDWKTCKIKKYFTAHTKSCTTVQWNPNNKCQLVSCGWDSEMKIWGN